MRDHHQRLMIILDLCCNPFDSAPNIELRLAAGRSQFFAWLPGEEFLFNKVLGDDFEGKRLPFSKGSLSKICSQFQIDRKTFAERSRGGLCPLQIAAEDPRERTTLKG